MHPSPGRRAQSTAARLATSGETFERGEAVDTYAQAIVQGRGSPDRLLSQTDDPSLRRRVPEAVGSAERPCHAKRPGSYHKADPFIVHQLAVLASQALRFVSSVRAV
jgi:hypothetical protein